MGEEVVDRASGLGGTDIAGIVGLSPHKTRFSVYCDKLGLVPPFEPTQRMKMGTKLQPVIVDLYQEATGQKVQWFDKTIRHPKEPIIIGTPDGFVLDDEQPLPPAVTVAPGFKGVTLEPGTGFEAKTAGLDQAWRWGVDGDNVPEEYLIQCQWYMALTGRKAWELAVLIGGDMFRHFSLSADLDLQALLYDEGKKFWADHVAKQSPPEIDASRAAKEYLRQKFPEPVEETREATDDELGLMRSILSARNEIKFMTSTKAMLENKLRESIGPARGVKAPTGDIRALWSWTKPSTYTVERKGGRRLDVRSKKESQLGDDEEP